MAQRNFKGTIGDGRPPKRQVSFMLSGENLRRRQEGEEEEAVVGDTDKLLKDHHVAFELDDIGLPNGTGEGWS